MFDQERGMPSARLLACAVLCTALIGLGAHEVTAQTTTVNRTEEPKGFLSLSLQDLIGTDGRQITALGTHTNLAGAWTSPSRPTSDGPCRAISFPG